MSVAYRYYALDGVPCRVAMQGTSYGDAEMYKQGQGFVSGPKTDIVWDGKPISKAEFDAMILALVKKSNAQQQ